MSSTNQPDDALGSASADDQRRRLELELIKVRSEAQAARLEAKAAEIELILRECGERTSVAETAEQIVRVDSAATKISKSGFNDWAAVRAVMPAVAEIHDRNGAETVSSGGADVSDAQPLSAPISLDDDSASNCETDATNRAIPAVARIDGGHSRLRRPHFDNDDSDSASAEGEPDRPVDVGIKIDDGSAPKVRLAAGELDSFSTDEEEFETRRRPAAFVVSVAVHVAILLLLAFVTLQTHRPKDQVALSASAPEASEVAMETFEIESSEPESEPTEVTPVETEYEISDVGTFTTADIKPDKPPTEVAAPTESFSTDSAASAMSLSSDSDAKIQFCGVEGGGNHFVYLVDSSKSMDEGFQSARDELLHSIDFLKPDQRFYVVFFDADSSYMRLTNANQDEPRSMYATPQNKAALKRWAMRIAMDRGKAPYDALRFALKLRPDAIFLLSDGQFPQGIEDLLKEENKVENLFGDSGPISIVHTISYHSKEGESRMRRIAEQNKGKYRHVAKQ